MREWELALERWRGASLIDAAAAERIRLFEESRTPDVSPPVAIATAPADRTPGDQAPGDRTSIQRAPGLRWPAIVALVFGGLMLGAGVLLFVAAHWDNLSPGERFALVVGMVAVFHGAGALADARKGENLAIVMHGLGTASLGAAIFLTGQIFNLQAHWPLGIMLWAAGAWIGYALRRDWVQFTLAAMLTPSWLAGEWIESFFKIDQSIHVFRVLVEGMLLLSITYFAARSRELDSPVRRALVWIGGIALLPYAIVLAIEREVLRGTPWGPLGTREILGYAVAFGLPLALAWWLRRRDIWMNLIAAAWVFLLAAVATHRGVGVYAWCGLGAVGLVAWGVRDARSERVNMGMAGFAITLFSFYFSEVMDKLDRSASLIGLGVLFLAGGWGLERLRRRFVAQTRGTL
jgi:uncharacterized membrane protein